MAHRGLPAEEKSEVFYGGAAGGGKSDWLLMGALEYVDVPDYAAIIFRRSFTDLALPGAIMARSKQWLRNTDAIWNEQSKQWRFPAGSTLQFAYMDASGDEQRYQSAEFQYCGFDELTQFPEEQYVYLFSRLRRPELNEHTLPEERRKIEALKSVPLRMRAASNPGGVGHGWVKDRFPIDGKPRGDRIFVPAKMTDNPHLDVVAYRASLAELGETLQKQLEDGDWDVAEGLAYTITSDHLVSGFRMRDSFNRFEAADYGLNGAPWALWATDYEGNLVVVDMIYERDRIVSELCQVVLAKRKAGWGFGNDAFVDPSVWHRTGGRDKLGRAAMLSDEFPQAGVPVAPANNDPRAGMMRLRELLKCDPVHSFPDWHGRRGEKGSPRLFFDRRCEQLVKELRNAPLQPVDKRDGLEMVDPEWESKHGHACAMARYAVMTWPSASKRPYEPLSDPRAEALRRHEARRDSRVAAAPSYDW